MSTYNKPQCESCKKHVPNGSHFCMYCGSEIKKDQKLLSLIDKKYQDAYGTWRVTTEGDVEGRSIKQLGTYEGYLDEIAKSLSHSACYSLNFKKVSPVKEIPEPERSRREISVQLDIDSKTWDMGMERRAEAIAVVLKDRPVSVKKGQYYASFIIEFNQ